MIRRPKDQKCPERGVGLTHMPQNGGNLCGFCRAELFTPDPDDIYFLGFLIPRTIARRENVNSGGPLDAEPLRRVCSKCKRERECYVLGNNEAMCVLCVDGDVNSRKVRNDSIRYRRRGIGIFKGDQPSLEGLPLPFMFDRNFWEAAFS